MADVNNEAANSSGEDSNADANGKPPVKDDASSSQPTVSAAEQARRDQQSKKDQAVSQTDDLREQVDFLSSREAERARDGYVSELLTSQADKFPNVKSTDPMFKYATSKEEVEEIATNLQNTFTDLQQNALRSVQTESDGLTDEQIAEQEIELEKQANNEGKSTFGSFIGNLQRRKK